MTREPDTFQQAEDRFERHHSHCEAALECRGCGRSYCPRCEVSPGEPDTCPECWWTEDPEGDAA
jgi:hypothetical protein